MIHAWPKAHEMKVSISSLGGNGKLERLAMSAVPENAMWPWCVIGENIKCIMPWNTAWQLLIKLKIYFHMTQQLYSKVII